MVQNDKKKKEQQPVIFAIMTLFFFAMAIILFITQKKVLLNQADDFYEKDSTTGIQSGDYVSLNVNGVLGNYAETRHTYGFIPVGTDQHYIVWLDNGKMISLKANSKKMIDEMERICEDTWEYLSGSEGTYNVQGIELKGAVSTLDSELKGFYREGLNAVGANREDIEIIDLTIDTTSTPLTSWLLALFFLGMAALMLFQLVQAVRNKRLQEDMGIPAPENSAESGMFSEAQVSFTEPGAEEQSEGGTSEHSGEEQSEKAVSESGEEEKQD